VKGKSMGKGRGREAGEADSDEETMAAFAPGWHCRPWGNPMRRHRHQGSQRTGTVASAPGGKLL